MTDMSSPICIKKIQIVVYRVPIATPVRTSFGTMYDRPAVLLRLEDQDGAHGWGEAWCNFPSCGAEHRGRLLETVIAPHLLGVPFSSPQEAFAYLTRKVRVLALQTDEPGPLAQTVAAADIALWDMFARKAGLPLHRMLGGTGDGAMPAYASGINPTDTLEIMARSRAEGYRCFKFKVGFNHELDMRNLRDAAADLRHGEGLAVDANQAWDLPQALSMAAQWEGAPLQWLEEPLRCDAHISQWEMLRDNCPIPLAGGENIRDEEAFYRVIRRRALAVMQPDVCKWGGISAVLPVARAARAAGLRYCPHYLGGGIGLMASAHLLAAVGGDGLLEIDVNPNPLREALAQPYPALRDGLFCLSEAPGLGVEPDCAGLQSRITYSAVATEKQ